MNIKSEKEFYAEELSLKVSHMDTNIFIWGEDMIDKNIVIYPKKLKEIEEYELVKENLEPCGVVLVDTRKSNFLRCASAIVNVENGYVYFSTGNFNSAWKVLRNSVNIGIRISKEQTGTCPISKPEDILVLDYLQRPGSEPVLENYAIKYVPREMTDEEKYRNSRKQSFMDNPKMLYFYSDYSTYFHDKECDDVKKSYQIDYKHQQSFWKGKKFVRSVKGKSILGQPATQIPNRYLYVTGYLKTIL